MDFLRGVLSRALNAVLHFRSSSKAEDSSSDTSVPVSPTLPQRQEREKRCQAPEHQEHPRIDVTPEPAPTPSSEEVQSVLANRKREIARVSEAENDEYQKAVFRLRDFKTSGMSVVVREFEAAENCLRSVHERVKAQLDRSNSEVEAVQSSPAPLLELEESSAPSAPCYTQCISNPEPKLQEAVSESVSLALIDPEQFYLPTVPKVTDSAEPKPVKKRKPSADSPLEVINTCQSCHTVLRTKNYMPLPGHRACLVCLDCIRTKNTVRLLCPVCRMGFDKESKAAIEYRIPGLLAMLTENRQKKVPPKCDTCHHTPSSSKYHTCVDSKVRCLDCHQRLIAASCYRKKRIQCPECKKEPTELARENPRCAECMLRLYLNEVAHWCKGRDYLVCARCEPECRCADLE